MPFAGFNGMFPPHEPAPMRCISPFAKDFPVRGEIRSEINFRDGCAMRSGAVPQGGLSSRHSTVTDQMSSYVASGESTNISRFVAKSSTTPS